MTDKAMFIGLKTHLHGLGAKFHRLVGNVPPVHPIALGGGLKWRTRVISDGG